MRSHAERGTEDGHHPRIRAMAQPYSCWYARADDSHEKSPVIPFTWMARQLSGSFR